MADVSASTIRTAINTQLSAVTELVGGVTSGRTMDFAGFPCARYYLSEIRDELADNRTNYRSYVFTIDVVMGVSISGVTKTTTEAAFQDAIDAVMDKLNNVWQLGTTIESSRIEGGAVREEEIPQGIAILLPITFTTRTLINLS